MPNYTHSKYYVEHVRSLPPFHTRSYAPDMGTIEHLIGLFTNICLVSSSILASAGELSIGALLPKLQQMCARQPIDLL